MAKSRIHSALSVLCLALAAQVRADILPEWEWAQPQPNPAELWSKKPPNRFEREAARRQTSDWQLPVFSGDEKAAFEAARAGNWALIAKLLKQGLNPSLHAQDGTSLLSLAVEGDAVEMVRDLVRRGAELDRRAGNGFTPLGAAALHGRLRILDILIAGGADLERKDATGATALMQAARMGHLAVVDHLLRAHADPLHYTREGMHALAVAAGAGRLDVIDRLLAEGLAIDLPDRGGRSALYWSVYWQQPTATQHLLGRGAQLSAMTPTVFN